MSEDRLATVRAAYESFNRQDLDQALGFLADDVQWPDVVTGSVLEGKDAVRAYFERVFAVVSMRVTVGDLIPLGDAVLVTTYQQFYDLDGSVLGPPRMVVNRYTFEDDRATRMEVTSREDIPDEVRRRYLAG